MKSLLLAALFVSASAFAMPPLAPEAYKSTEVLSCAEGNRTLSVQVLTNAYGSDVHAVGTFVDYRVNGQVAYSSSSFQKPYFIAAGAGGYSVRGTEAEVGSMLTFGHDYMAIVANLEVYPAPGSKGVVKSVFSFNNCRDMGTIGKFVNIGNPTVDTVVPAPKKKNPTKKWDILRKI